MRWASASAQGSDLDAILARAAEDVRGALGEVAPDLALLFLGPSHVARGGEALDRVRSVLGPAPVIFGEEGDEPLLGATTLESLGLILDPFKRRLIPMRMMLA